MRAGTAKLVPGLSSSIDAKVRLVGWVAKTSCSFPGCDLPEGERLCDAHAWRARHGKPMDAPVRRMAERGASLKERLLRLVDVRGPEECWEFKGHVRRGTATGVGRYGRVGLPGGKETDYAHRISYRVHKGEVPDGLEVRHMCNNPPCCNPAHLDVGTRSDNVMDSVRAGTHFSPFRKAQVGRWVSRWVS